MKKFKIFKLISAVLFALLFVSVSVLASQGISVYMNDEKIEFDVEPVVENGRTMVPMRTIFEKLGADVTWVQETNTVIAQSETAYVSITIGSNVMHTSSEVIELESPAMVIEETTMVPLRAVSEAFDCDIKWDGETKTVNIYGKDYMGEEDIEREETEIPENDTEIPEPEEIAEEQEDSEPIPVEADRPRLIAHAGGQIYGYKLTNSKEALDLAYENGFRHIEVDIEMTSDMEYVLLHDWQSMAKRMLGTNRVLKKEEFLSAKAFRGLTLLDFYALIEWMKVHDDCYIVTDVKCDNRPFIDKISRLKELKDNFIVQVYDFEQYDYAKEKGLENVILTLYRNSFDEKDVIKFAKEKRPWAITLPEYYITENLLQTLKKNGTATYLHTVDELYIYEEYKELGLYGIYTNFFEANHWEE